jgi:hypothetical protein
MHVVKARILEAKTNNKARTLKAKEMIFCPRGSTRLRPPLEDYITADKGQLKAFVSRSANFVFCVTLEN